MEGQNNLQIGKYLGQLGNDGKDLKSANDNFICNSNVIRVAASEASYFYNENRNKGTDGIFLPANTIEYFKVEVGNKIILISGKINISSVY